MVGQQGEWLKSKDSGQKVLTIVLSKQFKHGGNLTCKVLVNAKDTWEGL